MRGEGEGAVDRDRDGDGESGHGERGRWLGKTTREEARGRQETVSARDGVRQERGTVKV